MKQLLTTTLLLVCWFFSQGQTITISGQVENTGGDPVEGVTIYIATDSTLIGPGYYNTVQTDENGNYSDSFEPQDNATQGILYVTMEDCNNNLVYETAFWNPGSNDLTVDFIYCDLSDDCSVVAFLDSIPGTNSIGLYAAVSYNGEISYSWSTGETTQDINVTESGTYCVTITDTEGCSDADCITVDLTPNNCSVDIDSNPTGSLSAIAQGTAPFTYAWSTGEVAASIFPNAPGSYCVTMTDADGCTATDCYFYGNPQDTSCFVYLSLDSITAAGLNVQAVASGTAPFSYEWSTGATTSEITITESGLYCVTVTDAEGCVAVACEQANVNPCQVSINFSIEGTLVASSTGVAPFAYAWNTGETAVEIDPEEPGLYCVTITDAEGCVDFACIQAGNPGNDTLCNVTINQVQGGTLLEAVAEGTAPFVYAWNTQETTQTIVPGDEGTYCVTVTDATGCESSACFTIEPSENFVVEGYLFLQDSSQFADIFGTVYLYEMTAVDGPTLVDSVAFGNTPNAVSWYSFGEVPAGDYIVLASLSPESPGYDENLPTYYGDVLWWDEATVISVPYAGFNYFSIVFVEGENPGGEGFIGGSVIDLGFTSGNTEERDDPLAFASILLLDENDQPLTHTHSDGEGNFEFANLSWGTYKVYLEIPGHEQQHVVVTIGPDNPEVRNIEFEVEDGTVTSSNEVQSTERLLVYPNPVNDQLNVLIENAVERETMLIITDSYGKQQAAYRMQLNAKSQTEVLNVASLAPGIYFLSLNQGGAVKTVRFVKF